MEVDLKTDYLGLTLRNPLIVAACPLTREIHRIEQLEQAGASAVVMYSLFAEQIANDPLGQLGSDKPVSTDARVELPAPNDYVGGLDAYLRNLKLAKKSVSIPIIGSLNGGEKGDWTKFAPMIEQAGADALELNVYFVPTDPNVNGSQIEDQYVEIISLVRSQITIPLSVKLGPFFSSLPNLAARISAVGVDGLVLFNRFMQPDIEVDTFEVIPRLTLSDRAALRLPLRWIAILRSQLSLSLAASSGAHVGEDVIKLLLAGADVVSVASTLLRIGPAHLTTMLDDLVKFMNEKSFASVKEMRGLASRSNTTDGAVFERANYIKSIITFDEDNQD